MEPSCVKELCDYLKDKSYTDGITKNQKRRLREKTLSFTLVNDVLHHRGCKGKLQRVVRKDEVDGVISTSHASLVGGCHFGQNSTQRKVSERYWWPTMTEDIRHAVRTCER